MGRLADVFPQSDGSLFIVGTRGAQGLIARIDAQGVIDTSFGAGGFVLVSDADPVVLTGGTYDSRGNVVAVGYAGAPARALVVRVR